MNAMKRYTGFLTLSSLALLPLLQGCETGAAWEGTVTDSAGVAIVVNTSTPLWASGEEWTVTEDLRIGSVAGEPEYQFGQLGFIDVGPDGTIYAMDAQALQVDAYDAEGNYLRTIGGPGGGPGELARGAIFVYVDPDGGIVIPDTGNRRVNRYASDGTPLGSFPIDMTSGVPIRWLVDDSGRVIAQLRGLNVEGMAALEGGDPIVVYDTTGTVVDTVAVIPQGKTLEGVTPGRASIKVFAPEPVWDLGPDGSVYYAMNDQFEILVNAPDGPLVRKVRKDLEPQPVEESDQNALRRAMRQQYATFGVPPQQIEAIMQGVSFAEFYPAFLQLFVGPDETIWVQRVRTAREMLAGAEENAEFNPQDMGSPEWEVFDEEGRFMGVVTLPERFQPTTADGDRLYGIWRDEIDVQYIMRLTVNRTTM